MTVYVGYAIDETGHGVPIAAGTDRKAVFDDTVRRNLLIRNLHGSMAVKERPVTAEQASELETHIADFMASKGLPA